MKGRPLLTWAIINTFVTILWVLANIWGPIVLDIPEVFDKPINETNALFVVVGGLSWLGLFAYLRAWASVPDKSDPY